MTHVLAQVQTTADILRAGPLRAPTTRLFDALSHESGVDRADLGAIVAGAAHPVAADIARLATGLTVISRDFGGFAEVTPLDLACRVPIMRAMDDDEEGSRFRFVMSDASPDRASDVVEQVWRLANFLANPVAPFNHDLRDFPVGRWEGVTAEPRLTGVLVVDDAEVNPRGRLVAHQIRAGFMRAVSVGFVPTTAIPRASLGEDDPRHGRRGFVFSGNELLEASPVTVPMQPRAVLQGFAGHHEDRAVEIVSEALKHPDVVDNLKHLIAPKGADPSSFAPPWMGGAPTANPLFALWAQDTTE